MTDIYIDTEGTKLSVGVALRQKNPKTVLLKEVLLLRSHDVFLAVRLVPLLGFY